MRRLHMPGILTVAGTHRAGRGALGPRRCPLDHNPAPLRGMYGPRRSGPDLPLWRPAEPRTHRRHLAARLVGARERFVLFKFLAGIVERKYWRGTPFWRAVALVREMAP